MDTQTATPSRPHAESGPSTCSADLETLSDKIRRGESVSIEQSIAVAPHQRTRQKAKFRRSREAMILDVIFLPLGLIRSLVLQGVPETLDEIRKLPETYSRGWRESQWFFLPNENLKNI
jgi:hypothetical protein